jgi:Fe(3+) dicitrate transport protein
MNSLPVRIIFISLLLMASSVIASAQGRFSLTGRVADHTGAAVGAATVTARQLGASFERSAKTGEDGAYRIDDLQPGDYQVSARREGFSLAAQTLTIHSEKGAERKLDFMLRPGQLAVDISVVSTQIAATQEEQARIPGSVEIIDARTLEISRPFNFNEALRKAPGVYTRDEEGFGLRPSIGIRGLDPNRSAKVLLLEDGVPLGHAPYGDTDAYYHPPIERYNGVEVLKGSSQIVHGPNTLSGAINYITRNPPENFSGSLTLLGGNRNYFNGYASVGATLGRTGFLLDFLRKQGEGARENMRFGIYDVLIKSVTKLTEDGRQTLGFKFNYYGEDSNVTYSGLTLAEFIANPRANPFRNDFFAGDRFGGSVIYTNAINSRAVFTTTIYGSDFNRDWWRQSSNSDQRPNRRGFNGCNGMAELNTLCGNEGRLRNYDAFGVDPRLKISSRAGETDIGFRYHREAQNRIQQNNNTGGPNGRSGVTVEDNLRRNEAVSGYIQHRFLFGKFAVTPGLRVEHVDIERTNRLGTPGAGKTDVTQVVPGFGVAYSPASRFTIFAGAHRGFSPPRPADIIDNNSGGVIELDPELSWNYEAGFRSTPARGLKLSATFFRLDYENQIVPANLSGGVGATLTSAGETLHQGLEFDWRWDSGVTFNSPHNFYARTAYTYVGIAEYRGARFSNVSGFNTVSITGNRLIYSPKHLAAATLGYSHASGFDALVEAIHTGEHFGDDLNTIEVSPNGQRGLLPAYTVWNAAVNYRIGKLERYAPTVFFALKNLSDETFVVDRRRGIMVGIPRLVQGGIKIRF